MLEICVKQTDSSMPPISGLAPQPCLTFSSISTLTATNEAVALKQIKLDPDLTTEGFPKEALREMKVLFGLLNKEEVHDSIIAGKEVVVGEEDDDGYYRGANGLGTVFIAMEVRTCMAEQV
jgi:hypothetical protein